MVCRIDLSKIPPATPEARRLAAERIAQAATDASRGTLLPLALQAMQREAQAADLALFGMVPSNQKPVEKVRALTMDWDRPRFCPHCGHVI